MASKGKVEKKSTHDPIEIRVKIPVKKDSTFVRYLTSDSTLTEYTSLTTATFTTRSVPSIQIPKDSDPYIYLQNFSFWNFFINISSAKSNNTIYYTDDLGDMTKYSVTLADGYYNITEFNSSVNTGVVANGHASGLLQFTPVLATQKTLVSISTAGWLINWPAGTPYTIVGYALNGTTPSAGTLTTGAYNEQAPNTAAFQTLTSINVHCSLANGQAYLNANQSDIIGNYAPEVNVGTLDYYEPRYQQKIQCPNLRGSTVDRFTISLTDQDNTVLDTGGEDFSMTVVIGYEINKYQ